MSLRFDVQITGRTPLHWASALGHDACAASLVQADPDGTNARLCDASPHLLIKVALLQGGNHHPVCLSPVKCKKVVTGAVNLSRL